ncbi:MAG: hypothetical protein CVU43_21980 [Chloroflexi bacterium HGW-Chloroflexi-5]|nr:MAG: hypothetical protein CVU43_21980 [Chloroflexi bacterium HGW-Chloroflexi-5]
MWFALTPKTHPACKQYFKVGWNFDQSVEALFEGQMVNVQVYNIPSGDSGEGFKECYQQGKQWAYDGGYLTISFLGGNSNHFHHQENYAKYWGPKSQYLMTLKPNKRVEAYPVNPGYPTDVGTSTGTLFVIDGIYNVGETDAPYGSFCFEISKGGVFKYCVMYTYDGLTGSITPNSAYPFFIQSPLVQHNIQNAQGEYWMQINLPGSIQKAIGKSLQIVIRFCDANGHLLPASPQEQTYRDTGGYVATSSPILGISDNNFALNDIVIWMPYYALNLSKTGYQTYSIFAYAEVFVDGKSLGFSDKTAMNVTW